MKTHSNPWTPWISLFRSRSVFGPQKPTKHQHWAGPLLLRQNRARISHRQTSTDLCSPVLHDAWPHKSVCWLPLPSHACTCRASMWGEGANVHYIMPTLTLTFTSPGIGRQGMGWERGRILMKFLGLTIWSRELMPEFRLVGSCTIPECQSNPNYDNWTASLFTTYSTCHTYWYIHQVLTYGLIYS